MESVERRRRTELRQQQLHYIGVGIVLCESSCFLTYGECLQLRQVAYVGCVVARREFEARYQVAYTTDTQFRRSELEAGSGPPDFWGLEVDVTAYVVQQLTDRFRRNGA